MVRSNFWVRCANPRASSALLSVFFALTLWVQSMNALATSVPQMPLPSVPSGGKNAIPNADTIALVRDAAMRHQIDPALVLALIDVESKFQSSAVSSKGARGLMQLMPHTAFRYGLRRPSDLHNPAINIEIGMRHLKDLLVTSNGNISLALASYNAGQGAIRRFGNTIPAYRETMLYVPAILGRIPVFQGLLDPIN